MRGTPDQAAELMKPYAGAIEAWEVGAEAGNVKNNRPELMERVAFYSSRSGARRWRLPTPCCPEARRFMIGRHLFALVAVVIGLTGLMSPSVGRPDSA
jgi:hypothetical protein